MSTRILELALCHYFPDARERERVRGLLARIPPPERERVSVAVLRLADGDDDKLSDGIEAACRDYRDVLAWTEYDAQFALAPNAPPADKRKARAADEAATERWLRKIGYLR